MSATTRTLELPSLDAWQHTHPAAQAAPREPFDPEPTTAAIPVTGAAEAIVVDEPDPGFRSLTALTMSPRRARAALMALAAGAFAASVNEGAVVALTPSISASLGVPMAQVGVLVTAFALTVVIAAVPLTMLAGRFAARTTLTATFVVWTAGVVVAATAGSFAQLAAGRIISAAAHGLFWGVVAPTAASLFAPHLRAMTVTRVMVGGSVAGVIGTPLVTVAGETVGWQVAFVALAAIGVALVIALALTLPGRARNDDDCTDADARPRAPHTIGDVPSLRHFARVLAVTFTMQVGMAITWTYIVAYYTGAGGVPKSAVPLLFSLGGIVGVTSTLLITRFLARHAVQTVGLGVVGVGVAWMLLAVGQPWATVAGQVTVSFGWAVLMAGLLNWAVRHTPWRTDVGSSVYMVTANLGAAVGPLVGGYVVATFGLALLPVVSLGLTAVAGVLVVTVDPTVVRRLAVPRQVRMALERREELRARRREWSRRAGAPTHRPVAAAWAVGQNAAQQPGAERRSLMAGVWTRPWVNARLAFPGYRWQAHHRARSRRLDADEALLTAHATRLAVLRDDAAAHAVRLAAQEHVAGSDAVLADDANEALTCRPEEQVAALQALDPYRADA
ncbi:MFS transporter [Demequina capsici]|uniref:MFS transporter n=1 Tax=Demequina capsici TaxID=3075620 RepID=A0AA96J9G0_9MICO|nr:MFS transporter [Demequina sp. PMTSA13]WNM26355.1 MFS transporter [Demequina sp. PMTSA13]